MAKLKLCRWNCGRLTDRRCGICLTCCNERDERNRQIDARVIKYVPARILYAKPKKAISERQRQSLNTTRAAKFVVQMPQGTLLDG